MKHPIPTMKKYDDGTLPDFRIFGGKKFKLLAATYEKGNAMHSRDMAMKQGARVRVVRRRFPNETKIGYLVYVRKEGSKHWGDEYWRNH